jgi:hypothetical protein
MIYLITSFYRTIKPNLYILGGAPGCAETIRIAKFLEPNNPARNVSLAIGRPL